MPRQDPRFNAFDVIRLVEKNLDVANKRLVFAWFFSLIPIKEPKADVVGIILDLLAVIPVAGSFASLFQVSLATAQVAVDIAELFKFEFEDQEVELARIRLELADLRKDFTEQREELLRCQIDLDNERERALALLATQMLLEEEIERLLAAPAMIPDQARPALTRISRRLDQMLINVNAIPGSRETVFIKNGISFIRDELQTIRRILDG